MWTIAVGRPNVENILQVRTVDSCEVFVVRI